MNNCVHFSNIVKKLIAQTLTFIRTLTSAISTNLIIAWKFIWFDNFQVKTASGLELAPNRYWDQTYKRIVFSWNFALLKN